MNSGVSQAPSAFIHGIKGHLNAFTFHCYGTTRNGLSITDIQK